MLKCPEIQSQKQFSIEHLLVKGEVPDELEHTDVVGDGEAVIVLVDHNLGHLEGLLVLVVDLLQVELAGDDLVVGGDLALAAVGGGEDGGLVEDGAAAEMRVAVLEGDLRDETALCDFILRLS